MLTPVQGTMSKKALHNLLDSSCSWWSTACSGISPWQGREPWGSPPLSGLREMQHSGPTLWQGWKHLEEGLGTRRA